MYRNLTVGVVVPAYNESGFVGTVIDDLPSFVDRAYVIDDGSTDDTWDEIRTHATARNEGYDGHFDDLVVPLQHDENRGVGGAIKTGYLRAREERIDVTAVLGGDDQMDPAEITRYLDPIADGQADYVKGNRFSELSGYTEMPRFRLLGNVILSYLTKIASGYWDTMDSQNGYAAISLRALEETDIEGMYEYYGYCNDLLVRLNTAGMRVLDVPRSSEYAYREGWKSHIDYREYIPRVSVMLGRSFLRRLGRKYVLTGYEPIAPLYLLGGIVSGAGALGWLKDRGESGGTGLLTVTVGLLTMLYATMLDREANADLQPRFEASAPEETADEEKTPAKPEVPETPVPTEGR